MAHAERKQARLLAEIDLFAKSSPGLATEPAQPVRAVPIPSCESEISLRGEGIGAIVWATGFRRSFPWLRLPVCGAGGDIEHRGGITAMSGIYALGFRFLRKRDSSFLGGVGADAVELSKHLARYLRQSRQRAA